MPCGQRGCRFFDISRCVSIVDRVNKLLALATSPNMHEARNAALLAAKLIREHGLEIREREASPRRKTPRPTPRPTPKPRRPSSKRNARVEVPPIIESPLGGECAVCGKRYRAGTPIHWSDADGGIHTTCIGQWTIKR
jgi:hypothetical protein